MLYTLPSNITKKSFAIQAEIIRIAVKALHDPEADQEMIAAAKSLLSEFFPTHGEWITYRNSYYGIPEMKMDRLDPEEMQQEVYLAMLENLPKISEDILEKDDHSVVCLVKSYIGRYMDAAAKRYVEKKNHISKYYATCVLHMYKYHNGMTIQGHTQEEIAEAVKDVYPYHPMKGNLTAAKLIKWSNEQLHEEEVSTSQTVIPYEMEFVDDTAEQMRNRITDLLTAEEQKVFDLLEEGKTKKEIKEILSQQGIEISVPNAIRTIRTAAITCMTKQQIANTAKAQRFMRTVKKEEYVRLSARAM